MLLSRTLKLSPQPHAESIDEVLKSLNVTVQGLSNAEFQRRLKEYGPNELREKKRRTALQMFLGEFKDIFILLLIAASVFSVVIGYYELQLPPLPGDPPKYPFEVFADSLIIIITQHTSFRRCEFFQSFYSLLRTIFLNKTGDCDENNYDDYDERVGEDFKGIFGRLTG